MATATAEPETTAPTSARVFRWHTYVHVGEDAEQCPDNGASCREPGHFHAWVRLPNQFLRDELRTDALAARARRLRQLRDPDSNAAIVLEEGLAELARGAERDGTEALVDAALAKDWFRRHVAAMDEAKDDERFEHIDADRRRHAELEALPADERPQDEWEELARHLVEWDQFVEAKRNEAEAPEREALEHKTVDELIAMLRDDRITGEATAAFMERWVRLNLQHGTYWPEGGSARPSRLRFAEVDELLALPPDVAVALRNAFLDLEAGAGPT